MLRFIMHDRLARHFRQVKPPDERLCQTID